MVFNSVAEVFDSLEQSRLRLHEQVEGLSEEQALFRPAEGVWSVAEIAEHLSLFEPLLLKLITSLVEKGEASLAPAGSAETIAPISMEQVGARTAGKKTAPEILQPTGNISLEKSVENLRQTREALLALKPRILVRDFTPVIYSNEAVGTLNLYQWIAFVGFHEQRHVAQITDLISSETFPAKQAASL